MNKGLIIGIISLAIVSIVVIAVVVIRMVKKPSPTTTSAGGATRGPSSDPKNKGDTLHVGQFLLLGERLQSGNYTAYLAGGNNRLFLDGRPAGSKGIEDNSNLVGFKLLMQSDGNLVILDTNGKVCWTALSFSPNTSAQPNDKNTRAVLQGSNGNLAVYNSLGKMTWSAVAGPA
jgi:hypothetical protein